MVKHPRAVELSNEGINGCPSRMTRLFEGIMLSVGVKQNKNVIHMCLKSIRYSSFIVAVR